MAHAPRYQGDPRLRDTRPRNTEPARSNGPNASPNARLVSAIVFSKDRPLQLDATLRSLALHCSDPEKLRITVLYASSSPTREGLYQQLRLEHPGAEFRRERQFRRDVLELISNAPFVAFVVDDAMFVREFSVQTIVDELQSDDRAIGFSLRLGTNTTYCYPLDAGQELPEFTPRRPGVLAFAWPGASYDFGYPFDLSSSVYRTADVAPLLQSEFKNPNKMEELLAAAADAAGQLHPLLLCCERSAAFCVPANLVQTEMKNRAGTRPDESTAALATAYERGSRIDIGQYDDFPNNACHQDVPLHLREPNPPAPAVSVIIPCYQQAEFLVEAVDSVIAQTMSDWEIVIVNDGSTDATAETAQRLVEQHPDHRIRVLNQPNQGVSAARNNAIAMSTGRYILPLDADDMLTPRMLERTVPILDSDQSVSIVYTDYQECGASSRVVRAGRWDRVSLGVGNQFGYCSLFRRGVWAATGGYNPDQHDYEDYDFWLACMETGVRAQRVAEPLYLYRSRPGTRTDGALPRHAHLRGELAANHPALFTRRLRLAYSIRLAQLRIVWRLKSLGGRLIRARSRAR